MVCLFCILNSQAVITCVRSQAICCSCSIEGRRN